MDKAVGVEFFCYYRDRPGSVTLREESSEQRWSYMDRYQAEMIARGPTLAADGDTPTGSLHILNLPGPAAARAFAFDEPNYQAGVYRDVLLRRWRNLLGRTMWGFLGGRDGGNRYLGARPWCRTGLRPYRPARSARADRSRVAAVRQRRHLAGNGTADPGTGPEQGALHLDP
jgi:uncharacterized protein YciI